MLTKSLSLKIFDSASMQRWNDHIRIVELTELDKQAHKMVICYILGKFEQENNTKDFDWIEIIEGGIFGFLQRIVVTDLKPQLLYKIKQDRKKYKELNEWVYENVKEDIMSLGESFCSRFRKYLFDDSENINKRILNAAHFYSTKWEFDIIESANRNWYEIADIKKTLAEKQEKYYDLKGMRELALHTNLKNFVDLCGQLRFQIRWSHLHRVPKTSVLGHMLITAMLTYIFTLQIKGCRQRLANNYFTALFHDLPEVLSRDVIAPVKASVKGLSRLIKTYERDQMRERVYKLIPRAWCDQVKTFTENEFTNRILVDGKVCNKSSDTINKKFNHDKYSPRDGELIRAVDHFCAFIEAYLSLNNGVNCADLQNAKDTLQNRYRGKIIAGIDFGKIYSEF